ncbi:MAG: hypothetical protein FWE87_02185 [Coriobacteriia bacterium]|nr:hypothetical protein [Coriobacteriia bacterium]
MSSMIVIPTFWTKPAGTRKRTTRTNVEIPYGNATCLNDPNPPLVRMLESLRKVRGIDQIAVIVRTTDPSLEVRADERVRELLRDFEDLDIFVMGPAERGSLERRLEQLEMNFLIPAITQESYGATRNLGLIVAAVAGCDHAIMLDDNEVIESANFLETALYGLGQKFESGVSCLAKTGYYIDELGRWQREESSDFTDLFWKPATAFNQAMAAQLKPPRLQPASLAFGGAMALHHDIFMRVAFDPWIGRGEDTDYLINARMHGHDVYFDDEWSVTKYTGSAGDALTRFKQDAFRFVYEHRKLEFAKSQVDLRQVSINSISPYPGAFIDSRVGWRAFMTGLLKLVKSDDRPGYFAAGRSALTKASDYARDNCASYFAFQRAWATMMERIWEDVALGPLFFGGRAPDRTALTGQFKSITGSFKVID